MKKNKKLTNQEKKLKLVVEKFTISQGLDIFNALNETGFLNIKANSRINKNIKH